MAATTDVLIPALEDARDAHAAVIDRFRTDATITPPGAHRHRLEHQAAEAQYHLGRIEDRMRAIRPPRGLLAAAGQVIWLVTRSAVRVTVVPLEAGVSAVTQIVRSQGPTEVRRLLRNAESEYVAAARALATCQAGKDIAEHLHDQETSELLAALRHQDEQLMEILEADLAQRARAVAAATDSRGEAAEGGSWLDVAMRTPFAAAARLRAALRRGTRRMRETAEGALREMPDVTRMAERIQGAATREQDLPVPGFSGLDVTEVQQRLRGLSQTELTVLEGYERAHAGRTGVLNAIEHLRTAEPWTGYDAMGPDEIVDRFDHASTDVVRKVLDYERRHQQRQRVISAAQTRVPG